MRLKVEMEEPYFDEWRGRMYKINVGTEWEFAVFPYNRMKGSLQDAREVDEKMGEFLRLIKRWEA